MQLSYFWAYCFLKLHTAVKLFAVLWNGHYHHTTKLMPDNNVTP